MMERPLGMPALGTLVLIALELATVVVLSAASRRTEDHLGPSRSVNRLIARELQLTDLALSTGTSYTRHPSQADFFAAHGSHPSAIDHFPAGSVIGPPRQTPMPIFEPERGAPR